MKFPPLKPKTIQKIVYSWEPAKSERYTSTHRKLQCFQVRGYSGFRTPTPNQTRMKNPWNPKLKRFYTKIQHLSNVQTNLKISLTLLGSSRGTSRTYSFILFFAWNLIVQKRKKNQRVNTKIDRFILQRTNHIQLLKYPNWA